MKYSLLVVGILGIGILGLALLSVPEAYAEARDVSPKFEPDVLDLNTGISVEQINRRRATSPSKQVANWRESPEMQAEFKRIFLESFYANGGEERAIRSIIDNTQRLKDAGNWRYVSAAITAMRESGLSMADDTEELFSGLLSPEYHGVGNVFHNQLKEYREWVSTRSTEHFHFPESRLVDYPMIFPPEMHFAYFSGNLSGGEYSNELLAKAAVLRDQSIREYARHILDKTVVLPSIAGASASSGLYFQGSERDEALALLLPTYQNISVAIDEVQTNYSGALRELFASYGYIVLPNR